MLQRLKETSILIGCTVALLLSARERVLGNTIATSQWQAMYISGFGSTGSGWQINSIGISSSPFPSSDVLQLTDNNPGEVRCAFNKTLVPINNGFTAQFTYTASGSRNANAAGFVFQNSTSSTNGGAGYAALGVSGSGNGYRSINNSFAVIINIYTGGGQPVGYSYNIGGTTSGFTAPTGNSPNFAGGHPIQVTLSYLASTGNLAMKFVDMNNQASFSTSQSGVNTYSLLNGMYGYVGFCGSDGASVATQQISNFTMRAF